MYISQTETVLLNVSPPITSKCKQNNFRIDSIFHQVGYLFDIPVEIHHELIREIDIKLKAGEISLFGK